MSKKKVDDNTEALDDIEQVSASNNNTQNVEEESKIDETKEDLKKERFNLWSFLDLGNKITVIFFSFIIALSMAVILMLIPLNSQKNKIHKIFEEIGIDSSVDGIITIDLFSLSYRISKLNLRIEDPKNNYVIIVSFPRVKKSIIDGKINANLANINLITDGKNDNIYNSIHSKVLFFDKNLAMDIKKAELFVYFNDNGKDGLDDSIGSDGNRKNSLLNVLSLLFKNISLSKTKQSQELSFTSLIEQESIVFQYENNNKKRKFQIDSSFLSFYFNLNKGIKASAENEELKEGNILSNNIQFANIGSIAGDYYFKIHKGVYLARLMGFASNSIFFHILSNLLTSVKGNIYHLQNGLYGIQDDINIGNSKGLIELILPSNPKELKEYALTFQSLSMKKKASGNINNNLNYLGLGSILGSILNSVRHKGSISIEKLILPAFNINNLQLNYTLIGEVLDPKKAHFSCNFLGNNISTTNISNQKNYNKYFDKKLMSKVLSGALAKDRTVADDKIEIPIAFQGSNFCTILSIFLSRFDVINYNPTKNTCVDYNGSGVFFFDYINRSIGLENIFFSDINKAWKLEGDISLDKTKKEDSMDESTVINLQVHNLYSFDLVDIFKSKMDSIIAKSSEKDLFSVLLNSYDINYKLDLQIHNDIFETDLPLANKKLQSSFDKKDLKNAEHLEEDISLINKGSDSTISQKYTQEDEKKPLQLGQKGESGAEEHKDNVIEKKKITLKKIGSSVGNILISNSSQEKVIMMNINDPVLKANVDIKYNKSVNPLRFNVSIDTTSIDWDNFIADDYDDFNLLKFSRYLKTLSGNINGIIDIKLDNLRIRDTKNNFFHFNSVMGNSMLRAEMDVNVLGNMFDVKFDLPLETSSKWSIDANLKILKLANLLSFFKIDRQYLSGNIRGLLRMKGSSIVSGSILKNAVGDFEFNSSDVVFHGADIIGLSKVLSSNDKYDKNYNQQILEDKNGKTNFNYFVGRGLIKDKVLLVEKLHAKGMGYNVNLAANISLSPSNPKVQIKGILGFLAYKRWLKSRSEDPFIYIPISFSSKGTLDQDLKVVYDFRRLQEYENAINNID